MEHDGEELLRRAWRRLRLWVRCPERVPGWDAIVVTAASPQQARLYQLQLLRAQQRGRIPPHTLLLAVPDPMGRRIGSGGATLAAIRALSESGNWSRASRLLLVHAGGDSKRVPWANAIGKAFLPLPFLSADQPDEPAALLLDHILAISSLLVQHMPSGVLIMTGDVLPCFDASRMPFPDDGAVVVTTRAPLQLACNHGIIISRGGVLVDDLLQKPSVQELKLRLGNDEDTALLDTGIFSVTGQAWLSLLGLALAEADPVQELLDTRSEMSLYEELAAAWVPARHAWLRTRPLGSELIQHLGLHRLYHYCADDLRFLHLGTSSETLEHLASTTGRIDRRHLSSVGEHCALAESSTVLASKINNGAAVGERSLIFSCTLDAMAQVGSRCVVMGVRGLTMTLPDDHCLWEVPLKDGNLVVTFCCSTVDNPKLSSQQGGTFCGKPWHQVVSSLGMDEATLWEPTTLTTKDLWNANLFPVGRRGPEFALWLMAGVRDEEMLKEWHRTKRMSLAQVQEHADLDKMFTDMSSHGAEIAAQLAEASIRDGLMSRDLSKLTAEMGGRVCKELLALCSDHARVPASRLHQVRSDLSIACQEYELGAFHERSVWQAVAEETAASVGQEVTIEGPTFLQPGKSSTVRLPVRVDIAGGWSDTPPWSTERKGCVLNMAVYLDGQAPVGAEVVLKTDVGAAWLYDDAENSCKIDDLTSVRAPFGETDPFRLVKAALVVTGFTKTCKMGLEMRTWASVPRGSGLGTSSILAAAVIRALLQVGNGNACDGNVARLVLLLEQLMGTGGGWQDQVGGIYPGLKCTTSLPARPLKFIVEPVYVTPALRLELEHRMLLVFTGQVRLAHKVLHKVVKRYLQRDALLISSIDRLAELAKRGQEAFSNSRLDVVGGIMLEAWDIHQELDPFCSNSLVDSMFDSVAHLTSGYKLAGAGGGGFAVIMAKDCDNSPLLIKHILSSKFGDAITVHNWSYVI